MIKYVMYEKVIVKLIVRITYNTKTSFKINYFVYMVQKVLILTTLETHTQRKNTPKNVFIKNNNNSAVG